MTKTTQKAFRRSLGLTFLYGYVEITLSEISFIDQLKRVTDCFCSIGYAIDDDQIKLNKGKTCTTCFPMVSIKRPHFLAKFPANEINHAGVNTLACYRIDKSGY